MWSTVGGDVCSFLKGMVLLEEKVTGCEPREFKRIEPFFHLFSLLMVQMELPLFAPCLPTIMDCYPMGTMSQNKLFYKLLWSLGLITTTEDNQPLHYLILTLELLYLGALLFTLLQRNLMNNSTWSV